MKKQVPQEAKMARVSQKKIDQRVERAYSASCSGLQIDIMAIDKVFVVGRQAIAEGASDAELEQRIRAFVDTIAVRR